jgi:hypothetical protein
MTSDEILKNTFANHAFKNFEISFYMSLITGADLCGAGLSARLLQQSLDEERRMAAALQDSIDAVTRRYVELAACADRLFLNRPDSEFAGPVSPVQRSSCCLPSQPYDAFKRDFGAGFEGWVTGSSTACCASSGISERPPSSAVMI